MTTERRLHDAERLMKQLRKSLEHSKEFAALYASRSEQHTKDAIRGEREIEFWEKEIVRMKEIAE